MASIWKHPQSKYWVACYTDQEGRQRKASTKIVALEKNRKSAMRFADEIESAYRRRMTTSQIMRVCGDLVKELTGEELESATVRGFLDGYMKRRATEVKASTLAGYKGVCAVFIRWLGDSADMELFRLEKRHILEFRDHLAATVSTASANKYLKYLRVFFRDAKRDRLIFENPCEDVSVLKRQRAENTRRGYTIEELRIVLREVAGTEWVSLIRFGLYTGQRLGDLASLRWGAVDLVHDHITITTGKTGRVVIVPICKPLKDHILALPGTDAPDGFVHPRAAELGVNHLSREFGEVLGRCGFRSKATHEKNEEKDGRSGRRAVNELTFHSLRHSAVSMMKNAGISPAVVQDLVGHESAEMSAHYTHIENDAKRRALETLPVI
jgi:integrase